jgi:hypothetical protein
MPPDSTSAENFVIPSHFVEELIGFAETAMRDDDVGKGP